MARTWAAPTLGVVVGEAADVVGAALDEDDDPDEPDGEVLPQPARAAATSAAGTANLRTGRALTAAPPLAAWLVPVVVRLAMLMALLPVVGPFLPT